MGNVEELFSWKKKKKNAWSQVTFTLLLKQRLGVTLPFGLTLMDLITISGYGLQWRQSVWNHARTWRELCVGYFWRVDWIRLRWWVLFTGRQAADSWVKSNHSLCTDPPLPSGKIREGGVGSVRGLSNYREMDSICSLLRSAFSIPVCMSPLRL